jgi:hypothetical protein
MFAATDALGPDSGAVLPLDTVNALIVKAASTLSDLVKLQSSAGDLVHSVDHRFGGRSFVLAEDSAFGRERADVLLGTGGSGHEAAVTGVGQGL